MLDHDSDSDTDPFRYVTAQWLASQLKLAQASAPWEAMGDCGDGTDRDGEPACMDVRLQVYPDGDAFLRTGDPQYDYDHRGYWGSSCVARDDDWGALLSIAEDMIDQARDMHADREVDP